MRILTVAEERAAAAVPEVLPVRRRRPPLHRRRARGRRRPGARTRHRRPRPAGDPRRGAARGDVRPAEPLGRDAVRRRPRRSCSSRSTRRSSPATTEDRAAAAVTDASVSSRSASFRRLPRMADPREAEPRRARGEVVGALGRGRHLPVRPDEVPRARSTRSTRRRRRSAARCTWARCSGTRRPTPSPGTGACGATRSSTRWAGTTTAWPPSAGCRTTTACAATRRCRTTRTSCRRRSPASRRSRSARQNFVELCDTARRRGREEVRGALALPRALGRLGDDLHDDRRALPARVAARRSCATSRGVRRTRPRRRRSGTSTTAPRSRRPSSRTASSAGAYHGVAFHGVDGAADILIETTRPELIPACVALVAHPDDERYQPLFGTDVTTPLFGVTRAGARAPARRPREGLGHRDDLHVRRHHRRRVVARAAAARRATSSAATGASCADHARVGDRAGPDADGALRRARGEDREAGAGADRRAADASRASWWGSPKPITHPVKFYERGSRRSRSSPRASGTSATAAASRSCATRSSPGAASCTGTRRTCASATSRGSRG